jgi:hypothetical protein
LAKSEIRFRQGGKIIGLTTKEFWSIGTTILVPEKEMYANGKKQGQYKDLLYSK